MLVTKCKSGAGEGVKNPNLELTFRLLPILIFLQYELTRRASNVKKSSSKQFSFRRAILPASVLAVMAFSGSANAFKVDTDNEDLDVRFDNTFRYTGGWRMQDAAPCRTIAIRP